MSHFVTHPQYTHEQEGCYTSTNLEFPNSYLEEVIIFLNEEI